MSAATLNQAPKPVSQVQDLVQTPNNDAFVSSRDEKMALQLWDQLEELKLECKLLELQNSEHAQEPGDVSDEQLIAAEREALEARSKYMLRNKIAQSAITVDPILKAVHRGASASTAEMRLLPLLNERDTLAMVHGHLESERSAASAALSTTERDNILLNEENKELSRELLALAKQVAARNIDDIEDSKLRGQISATQAEARQARRRWRVLKSVIAAVVVGSGVDWVSDDSLQQLVLDDEDDIG